MQLHLQQMLKNIDKKFLSDLLNAECHKRLQIEYSNRPIRDANPKNDLFFHNSVFLK
jgi:hypothetical protein